MHCFAGAFLDTRIGKRRTTLKIQRAIQVPVHLQRLTLEMLYVFVHDIGKNKRIINVHMEMVNIINLMLSTPKLLSYILRDEV